jgi:anti-anti-sigma factor
MMTSLINNRILEIIFDQQEITNYTLNAIKAEMYEKIANEDSYDIIIFDMTNVRYINSLGINFLIDAKNKRNKQIILKNCSETVLKVLDVLNLMSMFEFK